MTYFRTPHLHYRSKHGPSFGGTMSFSTSERVYPRRRRDSELTGGIEPLSTDFADRRAAETLSLPSTSSHEWTCTTNSHLLRMLPLLLGYVAAYLPSIRYERVIF